MDMMREPVRIRRIALAKMVNHARRELPLECCGLLSGRDGVIEKVHPAHNQKRSRTEFLIPIQELFAFFKDLRHSGRDHLGIYHSHPATEAFPSVRDAAEFHYPGVSYWIISLGAQDPVVRCFLWEDTGFNETAFEPDGSSPMPQALEIQKPLK